MKKAFYQDELQEILAADEGIFPPDVVQAAERFATDCRGAADGEMDIEFQETGRGYYAHLHELADLEKRDAKAYVQYRGRLIRELEEVASVGRLSHQMQIVQARVGKDV